MEQLEFTATENEAGVRIDRCLSDKYEELSRSYLQKLLKEQGVTVNGKAVKANYKIQAGVPTGRPTLCLSPFPPQWADPPPGLRKSLPPLCPGKRSSAPQPPSVILDSR